MLIDDVQQAMFSAMKARQARETAALRLALSALKSAAIDARGELPDEQAVAVLQREARKRREAEQVYRDAGRTERADQEAYERSVLERFLPAALAPAGSTPRARARAPACPRAPTTPWSSGGASRRRAAPGPGGGPRCRRRAP